MANHSPYLNGRTSSHLNPVRYPLFVWRFVSGLSGQNTTYTITAASEREARLQLKPQLSAVRLIFAARIRVQTEKPVTGMTSEDFCKNRLPEKFIRAYACPAPHKTGAGFDSLIVRAGSRYVSDKRFFCARNPSCNRIIMAGRDGETVRSAGSSNASLSTLSRPATMFDSVLARLLNLVRGAANMANHFPYLNGRTSSHLNPVRYPLFVWRFVSGLSGQSDQNNTTYTITAASEREARLQLKPQLSAVRLIFAARIRLPEGTHHV
ncbi:hypothetical protein CWG81_11625 [Salmonella enterica subsp. enterica serovar Schwarzengrund]|nr:hypothetical protein [Salmonella enterica subsp. enterica serovar Schwarzengrund]